MDHHGHSQKSASDEQAEKSFKEMLPYFVHIIWPILIICIIAKIFAPSTF